MVLYTLHAFISHNGFSKLKSQEGKPFAQEHTVSDREDVYLPARKSVCVAPCSQRKLPETPPNPWLQITLLWSGPLIARVLPSLPRPAWCDCLLWEPLKKPLARQKLFLSTAFLSQRGTHRRYFPKKKARGITFQSECGKKTKPTT